MSISKHAEFQERVELGLGDEGQNVTYLMRNVLTPEQKKFLFDNDLTISMICNGRYTGDQENAVIDWMKSVNSVVGFKYFITV